MSVYDLLRLQLDPVSVPLGLVPDNVDETSWEVDQSARDGEVKLEVVAGQGLYLKILSRPRSHWARRRVTLWTQTENSEPTVWHKAPNKGQNPLL